MSIIIFLVRAEDLTFYHSIYLRWHRHPHGLLNCSYDRHQFCKNWQTLTCKHYRIHFNTFCLAGFTDCSLLELHLLLLISHVALRASCVFILQNNKPIFTYTSCTLLLCQIELNPNTSPFRFLLTLKEMCTLMDYEVHVWTPYLLDTAHSSQPCWSCGSPSQAIPIFRFKISIPLINSALSFAVIVPKINSYSTHFCG